MKRNWTELSGDEYQKVWSRFEREFNFGRTDGVRSFASPVPFITYDIAEVYGKPYFEEYYLDLHEKMRCLFINCTLEREKIYALDWQHDCYLVDPRLEPDLTEFGEWLIPILPNGDYYFFLDKDFKWGVLGHPWKNTITIFGEKLIKGIEANKPLLFQ
ncbi:DUF2716 domain-containing protein [Paenibacillus aurantiacus]|uniref:DUF2716 domain-containing protein n=1 Tax=Paenibacillus aurantiacus TaxID=1936118 RepID=A0ABV5KV84_9BACL